MAKCDVYIENQPLDGDSSLMMMRFHSMMSQFDNPPDKLALSVKPKSLKFKLNVDLEQANPGQSVSNCFTSTKVPLDDGQLFACQFVNGRLVCRPLSHLITFRSDFTHLDVKEESDFKEEIKPVSVKFAAPDRQTATSTVTNNQDTEELIEEFRDMTYKNPKSRDAGQERINLFGQHLPKVKPDPDAVVEDVKPFLPDIKPKIAPLSQSCKMECDDSSPPSPRKSVQIKSKVKTCLLKAKIVSFDEVNHYIQTSSTDSPQHVGNKSILDALSEYAVLVQGNWAVKSEVLYGDSCERECTDVTGISINLFIAARDYLLWLFTQERYVGRYAYTKRVKMPDHDVLELFNQLATFRTDHKKWELKIPPDDRFVDQFPEVVQRQANLWKVRRANKLAIFNV